MLPALGQSFRTKASLISRRFGCVKLKPKKARKSGDEARPTLGFHIINYTLYLVFYCSWFAITQSHLQKGGYNLKQVTNVINSSVLTFLFDWFDWFHLLFAYSTRMLVYQVTQWQSLGMRQTCMYVSF